MIISEPQCFSARRKLFIVN